MVYQKVYDKKNGIVYKEIALINSTVSDKTIEKFKEYLDTIQSKIENVTTVMDFVGISSTIPTKKGATVSNISNYQKGDVVIDNSGVEYVNIAGGNSPDAWEVIGDATRLASIEEKINNLQVGGRNLLLNTNQGVTNWTFARDGEVDYVLDAEVTEDGTLAVKLETKTDPPRWAMLMYSLKETLKKLKPHTKYILSFDLKTNLTDQITVALMRSDSTGKLTTYLFTNETGYDVYE
jgi:hypothetical protein